MEGNAAGNAALPPIVAEGGPRPAWDSSPISSSSSPSSSSSGKAGGWRGGSSKVAPAAVNRDHPKSPGRLASGTSMVAENSQRATAVIKEVIKRAGNMTLTERDTDAIATMFDRFIYVVENYLASAPGGSLNILLLITGVAMVGMSIFWAIVVRWRVTGFVRS